MRRLFVFGCSYTKYYWPTWADLLSLNFDYYENWGLGGVGNQCIAQRVQECYLANNFTRDDTVIVQWSSYTRYDCYLDHWQSRGSVFSENENNVHVFTPQWLNTFFSEKGFLLNTLSNISFIQELLTNTGCTWYMTSMNDIFSLNTDIMDQRISAECIPGYTEYQKNLLLTKYPEFKIYTDKIWKYKNWLTDFTQTQKNTPEKIYFFIDDSVEPIGSSRWRDVHPTPEQFNIWLESNCNKLFDLKVHSSTRAAIVGLVNKIKGDNLFLTFADKIFQEDNNAIQQYLPWWPEKIKGL
jgi:hypothetical protein